MAKKKYYAVKKGKVSGIFETWDACKSSVDGYPGAEYKSFASEEEARCYLGENLTFPAAIHSATAHPCVTPPIPEHLPGQVIAYVDGSFDASLGRYSFGCILITPKQEVISQSGNGDNPDSLALRNVTGEMLGAMFAVQWCIKRGYAAVDIRYDYSGIEMWATGRWKAKNELTKKYAAYMQRNSKHLNITFTKITAHTGDYYNEMADKLAKRALTEASGIPKI